MECGPVVACGGQEEFCPTGKYEEECSGNVLHSWRVWRVAAAPWNRREDRFQPNVNVPEIVDYHISHERAKTILPAEERIYIPIAGMV